MTAEDLGKIVRETWVNYCIETGKTDKPDHIAHWEQLNDWGREVDRRIGLAIANTVIWKIVESVGVFDFESSEAYSAFREKLRDAFPDAIKAQPQPFLLE